MDPKTEIDESIIIVRYVNTLGIERIISNNLTGICRTQYPIPIHIHFRHKWNIYQDKQ